MNNKATSVLCLFIIILHYQKTNTETITIQKKYPEKILVLSYGSLVKQKDNKKTGALLRATDFHKTSLEVPISFTFIAGLPATLLHSHNKKLLNKHPLRRATATIDRLSKENKPFWFAVSKMNSLFEARNNLAAREGAPFLAEKNGYDLTHIYYVKKIDAAYKKAANERFIPGYKHWVAMRAPQRQQLSLQQLQQLVAFTIKQKADAAIWVALPSHVTQEELNKIIKRDYHFAHNTAAYIQKMPPGNIMSCFEKKVIKSVIFSN